MEDIVGSDYFVVRERFKGESAAAGGPRATTSITKLMLSMRVYNNRIFFANMPCVRAIIWLPACKNYSPLKCV